MTHAAPIVRADYDQLREIRDRFARDAATIREMRRALSREQDTLAGGDWVGEGARAFYDEMDHLVLPRIDRLGDALAQAGAAAQQILLRIQAAEHDAARALEPHGLVATVPAANPLPPQRTAGGLPIPTLAALQQNQGASNDCGEFASAAAINLLAGAPVTSGQEMDALSNRAWSILGTLGTRLGPDGATTPQQQANLINRYAAEKQLPLTAQNVSGRALTNEDLRQYLNTPDTAVLVTLLWPNDQKPRGWFGGPQDASGAAPMSNTDSIFGYTGHVMLLAAYDDNNGDPRWGFVNSWRDGGQELYWMTDADFTRAHSMASPEGFFPPNGTVVVTRRRDGVADPEPEPVNPAAPPQPR
ncbi:MAG: WXG100 family type VII secretion target [Thermoflexales bacterium]|nr:WXG100 family type VII secretion target [Thermoflexales bacterium]